MRFGRSFTGVTSSAQCPFSVCPIDSHIIFKKSPRLLYFFDPEDSENNCDLPLFSAKEDDTIFDLTYLEDGELVLLIQNHANQGVVHLARAFVDLVLKNVRVLEVVKRNIHIRTGTNGHAQLVYDDCGDPVLVSYPLNLASADPDQRVIELFHIGDFFRKTSETPFLSILLDRRFLMHEIWCDPFISRKTLYFFNQLSDSLFSVQFRHPEPSVDGRTYRCVPLNTYGTRTSPNRHPSRDFFRRSTIVFDEFVLAFFSHLPPKSHVKGANLKDEPKNSLWKLWLNSMTWEPLSNSEHTHLPVRNVSLRPTPFTSKNRSVSQAFLHGSCGRTSCPEKCHLFELRFSPDDLLPTIKPSTVDNQGEPQQESHQHSSKSIFRRFSKFIPSSAQQNGLTSVIKTSLAPTRGSSRLCAQKRSNSSYTVFPENQLNADTNMRRMSLDRSKFILGIGGSSSSEGSSSRVEGERLLSQQLRHAKEMGYSDADIWGALEMNNRHNAYRPFDPFISTSAMIDALSLVQKLKQNKDVERIPSPPRFTRLSSSPNLPNVDQPDSPSSSYSRKSKPKTHPPPATSRREIASLYEDFPRCAEVLAGKESSIKFPTNWTSSALSLNLSPERSCDEKHEFSSSLTSLSKEEQVEKPAFTITNSGSKSDSSTNSIDSSDGNTRPTQSTTVAGVNRSVSFNDAYAYGGGTTPGKYGQRNGIASSSTSSNGNGVRSSVQRLIDTFENENRRHFDEFQRINDELRRKLEASIMREEHKREMLRTKEEKVRQLELMNLNQRDLEKRLENANRRVEDMAKEVQNRETEIANLNSELRILRRSNEIERRKTEDIKNSLNSEIGRMVRDKEKLQELTREVSALKAEIRSKDELLQTLTGPQMEIDQLNAQLAALQNENGELKERQQQLTHGAICGVCMDSRKEVIFMPCLHFTCCKNCADAMDNCSICRLRIMGKIEFFQ